MTAFLLIVACLQVSARGFSQKINLSIREAPLEKVFKETQKQSGYSFWYKTRQLDKAAKVTLDLKNVSLELIFCYSKKQTSRESLPSASRSIISMISS